MASTTNTQRAALFSLASLHVILCSGTAYGWTALRPVLLDAGLFAGASEISRARAMSWISTLGIAANALCKMPLGFILDHAGPRFTAVLGGVMVLAGSALMALGDRESLPQMATGYFLLGVAGPFVQMPTFQFTELYGAQGKGTAMSQLVTCFELSTGVFELMNVAYFYGSKEICNLRVMFLAFGACGLFVAITSVLFWPDRPHRAPRVGGAGGAPPPAAPLAHLGLRQQLGSGAFWMAASFMCVHIFRQGFVLATLGPQMETFFPGRTAKMLSDAFSVVLPLGFIPMAILTATGGAGAILRRPMFAFFFVTVLSMLYGGLLLVPNVYAYLVLFVVFPLARQLVFSTFFSYCASVFGFGAFGRISGVASTLAGTIQLSMSPFITAVEEGGRAPFPPTMSLPSRWRAADVFLGSVPAVSAHRARVLHVQTMRRRRRRGRVRGLRKVLRRRGAVARRRRGWGSVRRGPGGWEGRSRTAQRVALVHQPHGEELERGVVVGSARDKWEIYASVGSGATGASPASFANAGSWMAARDRRGVDAGSGSRRRGGNAGFRSDSEEE
jgi:MFS family permease